MLLNTHAGQGFARELAVGRITFGNDEEKLRAAQMYMQCALQLLDDAKAPADVGAHLDMAICRLGETLSSSVALNESPVESPEIRITRRR